MGRIKMHVPKTKLPFYPSCEVKCRLQNGVSTHTNIYFSLNDTLICIFFHQVSELGCLDFVQNMTFTWNHQLANFILKIFLHMRLNIEEGCLSYDHQWNALMALSNRGNSCNYYWLARRNGRTCFVIAVIIKSLVWFAFCLLKCSLKHHYVSFCSYYCYINFFFPL